MGSRNNGKRELRCPVAKAQDKKASMHAADDHNYKMERAEQWVRRYAPNGSQVQSVNQRGFYYHKPGQIKSEFTNWLTI